MHQQQTSKTFEPREWTWIDRAAKGWPSGAWDGEPDKAQWKDAATGLDCLAVRNPTGGFWCGYVGVPESHPAFGKSWSDVSAEAHGGLTFADVCQPGEHEGRGICHVPYPGDPDHIWWVGFDCAHAWDHSPEDQRAHDAGEPYSRLAYDTSYKSLAFVRNECAGLASQLAELVS